MADTRIRVPVARVNMTGAQFRAYANRYHDAAIRYLSVGPAVPGFDPVPYYLLCQSLELHLKSYIWLIDRIGVEQIKKKYGHRLGRLWTAAKARGVGRYACATDARNRVIRLVGPYYSRRKLNYLDLEMIFRGYRALQGQPEIIPVLRRLTARLGTSLRSPILAAR